MTQNRFGLKFSQIKLLILSLFGASWYQPPGRNLAELTSEIGLLRSQLQKIKCMHKGNNPPLSPCSGGLQLRRHCLARQT